MPYPLSKGSGHMAGESTRCRSADIGTPNCVAHVGEHLPLVRRVCMADVGRFRMGTR